VESEGLQSEKGVVNLPCGYRSGYHSEKPQSVSPARRLLLALDLTPFDFVKRPCSLGLRDIFLE